MSMRNWALLAVLAVVARGAQGQVFRCTDVAGKTSYQATPCPGGKQIESASARARKEEPTAPDRGQQSPRQDQAAIDAAFAKGQVVVGMSKNRVLYLLGTASRRDVRLSGEEDWFYSRDDETMLITIERARAFRGFT